MRCLFGEGGRSDRISLIEASCEIDQGVLELIRRPRLFAVAAEEWGYFTIVDILVAKE